MNGDFDQNERIKEGWIEFLGKRGYDVFGTVTFATPSMSAHVAIWRAKKVLRQFCKENGIKRVSAFFVSEQHLSGTWHIHFLWCSGCSDENLLFLMLRGMWQFFFERVGRCSFERIRDASAVRGYVSKYMLKHPGDWSILGD